MAHLRALICSLPLLVTLAACVGDDKGADDTGPSTGGESDGGDDDTGGGDEGGESGGGEEGSGSGTINIAPVVDSVAITPDGATTTDELTCVAEASDGDDEEVTLTYAWAVDGTEAGTGETLAAGSARDSTVSCTVVASDGTEDSDAVSEEITIANSTPTDPVVDVTDEVSSSGDDIVCEITTASTDADSGDTVSYVFAWDADGAVYPDDFGSAIGPDTTTHADDTVPEADTSLATDWTCTVTATDGTATSGSASDSTSVTPASSALDTTRSGYTYASTGSYHSNSSNYAIAEAYTFGSDVTITGFGWHWAFGYCTTCELGVYTDDGGTPDALVGEIVSSSCGTTSGGNNEISGTSFSVTAGDAYLGWNFHDCSYGSTYYMANSGGASITHHYDEDTAGDGLPDPWSETTSVSLSASSVYPIGY